MRAGLIQMRSIDDVAANLAATRELVAEAARGGAELALLPENFAFMRSEGLAIPCAQGLDGEIVGTLRELARAHGLWIVGGTFPELSSDGRVHNTSTLISASGDIAAVYRKIHLFDVDLRAQGGAEFRESASIAPGKEVVVARTPFGVLGMSVCYDLRFPELYRRHADAGARFLAVPSAFAKETGRDHWEVLLRARAIENQCFVFAPAQWGQHTPARASHGRSLAIDPWGVVLAVAPDRPCAVVVDCDLAQQDHIRASLPALRHRQL
ncbi:MAG: carbon-nitrogen hydrolase family protein [Deltaproteobacteria bacterium]|nr:carbon-nitrogen hydrolase family protein [Deltaproteobacteria bacterium]